MERKRKIVDLKRKLIKKFTATKLGDVARDESLQEFF